jgi:hypothetical protein
MEELQAEWEAGRLTNEEYRAALADLRAEWWETEGKGHDRGDDE